VAAASELGRLLEESPLLVERADLHRCGHGTHSRTHDGRIVCWEPAAGARVAVDAESVHGRVPPVVRRLIGESLDFWPTWVATEVAAKLADIPIITWLSTRAPVTSAPVIVEGLQIDWVPTSIRGHEDLVVAVGLARRSGGGSPRVAATPITPEQEPPT
jgi:hypothetical protein